MSSSFTPTHKFNNLYDKKVKEVLQKENNDVYFTLEYSKAHVDINCIIYSRLDIIFALFVMIHTII